MIERYLRNNSISHEDKCCYKNISICSCGLLLLATEDNYPTFKTEFSRHSIMCDLVQSQKWDSEFILKKLFNNLSEQQKVDCLLKTGLINKPKKITLAVQNDIIKLSRQIKKLHVMWNVINDITNSNIQNPFLEEE